MSTPEGQPEKKYPLLENYFNWSIATPNTDQISSDWISESPGLLCPQYLADDLKAFDSAGLLGHRDTLEDGTANFTFTDPTTRMEIIDLVDRFLASKKLISTFSPFLKRGEEENAYKWSFPKPLF